MTYQGYPEAANSKSDIEESWKMVVERYHELNIIQQVIEKLEWTIEWDSYTMQNGRQKSFQKYPTLKQLLKTNLGQYGKIEPQKVLEYIGINKDKTIEYICSSEEIEYFGDSPSSLNQHEDNPMMFDYIHYTAYGGPNIWIAFTLELTKYKIKEIHNQKMLTTMMTSLKSIEHGHSWWGKGGVIDLTKNSDAITIFYNELEERIDCEISEAFTNGELEGII